LVYWDSCVFVSYIEETPSRIGTLDAIVEEARQEHILILTSALSITEVAYAAQERTSGGPDPVALAMINDLWNDPTVVLVLEFNRVIAEQARDLVRRGLFEKRSLKASDAVHLATAVNRGVSDFHTYDGDILKWDGEWFPVRHPFTTRPMLFIPPT
jgi:predicted nucleic acid-binding protein